MKVVIVSSGTEAPGSAFLKIAKASDFLIAADGGAEHCRQLNIIPDLILGDLDSISSDTKKYFDGRSEFKVFPEHKDHTDFALAVHEAEKKVGLKELHIFSWSDERIDYVLDHLFAVSSCRACVRLYGKSFWIQVLNDHHSELILQNQMNLKGTKISVYPLTSDFQIETSGLRWNLTTKDKPQSQSNEATTNSPEIKRLSGSGFVLLEF